jgi:pre-mRNA-processing factor 19
MFCSISEETPQEPVVSRKSGHIFEKRLIEKHIRSTGACPVTREPLALEDLMPLAIRPPMKPRPASLSSMPALIQTVQNEWDAVMLETYELKVQLTETRKSLAVALYEKDAAFRVIARLIQERDEAKTMLLEFKGGRASAVLEGEAVSESGASSEVMDVEVEQDEGGMTEAINEKLDASHKTLSKGRKRRIKQRVRDVATADHLKTFTAVQSISPHSSTQPGVLCMSLHPTLTNLCVTGGNDSNVVLCDRTFGKIIDTMKGHKKKITDVAFVGSTDLIVSASADHRAMIWGREEKGYSARSVISCHTDAVVSLAMHPSHEYLVTASADKSWAFHDIATGRLRNRSVGDSPYTAMAFHPDGVLLGACTADQIISMVDVKSMATKAKLSGHNSRLSSLAFSENGYYLATGDDSGIVKLWDLRKVECFKTIQDPEISSVAHLGFDGSGSYLSVAGADIHIFSTADWSLVSAHKDHRSTVTSVHFGENAAFFASTSMDRTVKFWSPESA